MATSILSPVAFPKVEPLTYQLPEQDRQFILSKSDKPDGKISHANLEIIEQQRIIFIQKHGNQLGV